MGVLGNIVTESKIDSIFLYNVVDDITQIIPNKPTLLVGWNLAKKTYPEANILDWKISENIYWTFGKREKRYIYEENLEKFKQICLNNLKNNIKYEFHNILSSNHDENLAFFKEISSTVNIKCLILNKMAYFFNENDKKITGISLRDIEYIGGDVKKFLLWVNSLKNVNISTNTNCVPYEIKNILKNQPYLLSIICV